MTEIIVHGIVFSPYVRSVLLGLKEKHAPHRLVPMRLGDHQGDDHRRRNPFMRVPTIEHDGFVLYETQAILRYIDALYSAPSFQPKDARAAARVSQIVGIVDCYLFSGVTLAISRRRRRASLLGEVPDEAAIAAALPGARICIAELERLKNPGRFLAGDGLSLADLMVAPQLDLFTRTPEGAAMLEGSVMLDWLTMMRARESMQATTPEILLQPA